MTLWTWTMAGLCMSLFMGSKLDARSSLWVCGTWAISGLLTSTLLVGLDTLWRRALKIQPKWHRLIPLSLIGLPVFFLTIRVLTQFWPDYIPPAPDRSQQRLDVLGLSALNLGVWVMGLSLTESLSARNRALRIAAEARAETAQAKLSLLRQQLHPHFLFNSLNTLAGLLEEDPQRAQKLLDSLSHVLDQALRGSDDELVPMTRELALLEPYIDIERMRWEETLRVTLDVAPASLDVSVPWMSTQTLVENAIKHSLPAASGIREVSVDIWCEGGFTFVQIVNTGDIASSPAHTRSGIGLSNLNKRLEKLYATQGKISLTQKGGRVWALMQIPTHLT